MLKIVGRLADQVEFFFFNKRERVDNKQRWFYGSRIFIKKWVQRQTRRNYYKKRERERCTTYCERCGWTTVGQTWVGSWFVDPSIRRFEIGLVKDF